MNNGYCNNCKSLVQVKVQRRENKVFLDKDCPHCGRTSTLISSDARRYDLKRSLAGECESQGCAVNCNGCSAHKAPGVVFVEVTNRCNMNCPICINNTPSMGFVFDPPTEYFKKIVDHYAKQPEPPFMQLFGGEPTMREDLFELIEYSRSKGLKTRLLTNGLKLADKGYVRRLVKSRPMIMFSYDGEDIRTYRDHRRNVKVLELKKKALRNLAEMRRAKVTILSMVSKGYNDDKLHEILQFCHDNQKFISAVYLLPLAHSWQGDIGIEAERITTEDVEIALDRCYPADTVEFLPASLWGMLKNLINMFDPSPIPFAGAHPNCESLYIFVSNGEQYVPVSRYLKHSVADLARDLLKVEKKLAARLSSDGLLKKLAKPLVFGSLARLILRHVKKSTLLKGKGMQKLSHAMKFMAGLLTGKKPKDLFRAHTNVVKSFHVIVLPFEDKENLETDRLMQCPNAFAYVDPQTDTVKQIPFCSWFYFKDDVMASVMEHYNAVKVATENVPAH